MTKQEFYELYNKSIYAVRLDLAMRLFADGSVAVSDVLEQADYFCAKLLAEDAKELKARF